MLQNCVKKLDRPRNLKLFYKNRKKVYWERVSNKSLKKTLKFGKKRKKHSFCTFSVPDMDVSSTI